VDHPRSSRTQPRHNLADPSYHRPRALGTTWAVWIGPIQTTRNTTWRTFFLVSVSRNTLWITAGQITHTAQTRWAILKPAIIRPTVGGTYRPHTTDTHRVREVTYRP
jgi:hypothetical protein